MSASGTATTRRQGRAPEGGAPGSSAPGRRLGLGWAGLAGLLVVGLIAVGAWLLAGRVHHPRLAAPLSRGYWMGQVDVTQYFPASEAWFHGRLVSAPGIPGKHREDWLYSGTGLAMEADGVGLDGRRYSLRDSGDEVWLNRQGDVTRPLRNGGWSKGDPATRARRGTMEFARGPSESFLQYWRTVAVDPRTIPLGSQIYIPRYRRWFQAQDTAASAVIGRHVDVYVPPPASPQDSEDVANQRVYVIPPRRRG